MSRHYLQKLPILLNGHWRFQDNDKIKEFIRDGKRSDPVTIGIVVGSVVVAGASVGSAVYSAGQENKQQKKLLAAQEAATTKAEKKAASAKSLAGQEAAEKIKKQRMAQTNTILTSPLGISEITPIGTTTLGGE